MSYFKNAKEGDEVFGFVFGSGVITQIMDGWFAIMVEFENGSEVPYTMEGIPQWGNFQEQTCFYADDICEENSEKYDFEPVSKVLTPKKIIKLRNKNKLEVKCPSGVWVEHTSCPKDYLVDLYEKGVYTSFRKKPKKKN